MVQKKHIGKKGKAQQKKAVSEPQVMDQKRDRPIGRIMLKFMFLTVVLLTAIVISDKKGLFNADQRNDHTLRKWNSFYDFTKKYNADILLLGNSHLYTGINPKNLSIALGANAFILASPGTMVSDSYFSLKEALKRCKPSLVIIETYGIKTFNQYELEKGGLSDQLKSFAARKDLMTKLGSTPCLFASSNFIHAWSSTIRNHDYIFTNPEQLKANRELNKKKNVKENEELYLGRYVRFTTGIEEDIMKRYQDEGAPVDGNDYAYNKYTEKYVEKITTLCEKNGIAYMFLTLPMYHRHIKDYPVWKNRVAEIIDKYPVAWLDMQEPFRHELFTPICFENTYKLNQHMTYQGSMVASYMLANYIREEMDVALPNRKQEQQWHNLFYGDEGYFENNSPHPNDKRYVVLGKNQAFEDLTLSELMIFTNGESKTITAKVNRASLGQHDLSRSKVNLALSYVENGEIKATTIPLSYDWIHTPADNALYSQSIRASGIDFVEILDARILF